METIRFAKTLQLVQVCQLGNYRHRILYQVYAYTFFPVVSETIARAVEYKDELLDAFVDIADDTNIIRYS